MVGLPLPISTQLERGCPVADTCLDMLTGSAKSADVIRLHHLVLSGKLSSLIPNWETCDQVLPGTTPNMPLCWLLPGLKFSNTGCSPSTLLGQDDFEHGPMRAPSQTDYGVQLAWPLFGVIFQSIGESYTV